MIKARFQHERKGTLYKKGDEMKGFTKEQEAELVYSGIADWQADEPDELPNEKWTVSKIKDWMDSWNVLYTDDMLKKDLLDKISELYD